MAGGIRSVHPSPLQLARGATVPFLHGSPRNHRQRDCGQRTTMTGNIVDVAEKKTRPCRLALMAAPLPPSDGPARRVKMRCRYAGVPHAGPVTWRMRR